jgi:hypothetical protein
MLDEPNPSFFGDTSLKEGITVIPNCKKFENTICFFKEMGALARKVT